MWPTRNVLMRVGKGRDKNIITPGTIIWECALARPHLFLTVWPQAPQTNGVFWSILLGELLLSAGLRQARDLESESNYRDNYDCDLVRPGFVFKWTHLPWALELRLLRDWVWTPRLCRYRTDMCVCAHTRTLNSYHSRPYLFFNWMRIYFSLTNLRRLLKSSPQGLHLGWVII